MRFLSPFTLLGLSLIALPIAIHLLVRRRAAQLDFPSLKFVRNTPSFRLRPRRIQQPLLLALRISAIALLVTGLASPVILFFSKSYRRHVILIDASLSMKARGRSEAAKEQVRALINNLGSSDRAAIVAFGSGSLVLAPMTSNKKELIDALGRYHPTNGEAEFEVGFHAASALLKDEPDGETIIDVISDFQLSNLPGEGLGQRPGSLAGISKVMVHPVGGEVERNAFLRDEDILSEEAGISISASELVDAADVRSGTRKSWDLNGKDGVKPDVEWRTEPNGLTTIRIATFAPDDFDADDNRYLVFGVKRAGRALLIVRDSDDSVPYMRAAFEATVSELGDKRFVFEQTTSLPASSELNKYSLVTLGLSVKPDPNEIRIVNEYVSAGGTLWLFASDDVDTSEWNKLAATVEGRFLPFARIERRGESNQSRGFGAVDADSPSLRSMNVHVLAALRSVRITQGFTVLPRNESETVVRWSDGTSAFAQNSVGDGSVLFLSTSPARSAGDLGTSASFPALVSSIVRFSMKMDEPSGHEIGQAVKLGLAPNTTVKIFDAKGKWSSAQARDLVLAPEIYFPEPGIYRVESDGGVKYLAMNTPIAESENALASAADVERAFAFVPASPDTRKSFWQASEERAGNAWRYLLITAFALLIAELRFAMSERQATAAKGAD